MKRSALRKRTVSEWDAALSRIEGMEGEEAARHIVWWDFLCPLHVPAPLPGSSPDASPALVANALVVAGYGVADARLRAELPITYSEAGRNLRNSKKRAIRRKHARRDGVCVICFAAPAQPGGQLCDECQKNRTRKRSRLPAYWC